MRKLVTTTEVTRILRLQRARLAASSLVLVALTFAGPALALTLQEAIEQCRQSVGRPIVQSCMGGGHRGVVVGADLESCKAKASPAVKACVEKTMNAAHGRANVPVAIPVAKPLEVPLQLSVRAAFVPPPRTISDITAILEAEKPDNQQIQKLKVAADAPPPTGGSKGDLAWFFYHRGNARAQLGRINDAIDDANKAMEVGRGALHAREFGRLQQFAGLQYSFAGNPKQALAVFQAQIRDTDTKGAKGHLFGGYRQIAGFLIQMGDIEQADAYLRRNLALIQEARTSGFPLWREAYATLGQAFEADVDFHRAQIFEARGQFREAEAAYRQAELRRIASVSGVLSMKNPHAESLVLQGIDLMVLGQARMKARQGRLAEAESDARRALLSRLKKEGKYNTVTSKYVMGLADVLVEQGRYGEAEKLARVALEINREVGVAADAQSTAQVLSFLGSTLNLQRKSTEAAAVYAELDKAIVKWEPQRRQAFELNGSRIYALYSSGQVDAGLAAAQALLKREISRVGEKHFDTAVARGTVAIGLVRANKRADAIREFRTAIPVMMAAARENADDDDTTVIAARRLRLQDIVEAYIRLARHEPKGLRRRLDDRNLPACRCHSRPVRAARTGILKRAHDCKGSGPRRPDTHRAGSDQANQRPARHAQQCADAVFRRARRKWNQGDQFGDRKGAHRSRQGAQRDRAPLSLLCRPYRPQAPHGREHQERTPPGRGSVVRLSGSRAQFPVGCPKARTGRVCVDCGDRR